MSDSCGVRVHALAALEASALDHPRFTAGERYVFAS
jgi:hypothetical protein